MERTRQPLLCSVTAGWVLTGLLAVALLLRAPITGVPPVLHQVSETLALTPIQVGLVSTLPLLCFGVFAFLTPALAARFGLEPTLWVAALLILLGALAGRRFHLLHRHPADRARDRAG